MDASEIVQKFNQLGIRLYLGCDGNLRARPLPPRDALSDELRELLRFLRQREHEVVQLLSERPDMSNAAEYVDSASVPNTPDMSVTLPLNLVRIADAVAANPRSPVLTDMALAVFVRHAIEAQRVIERLPAAAKAEALTHCREAENHIVAAITGHNYEQAYALVSMLPDELCILTAQ
jgi:hypothetical protein